MTPRDENGSPETQAAGAPAPPVLEITGLGFAFGRKRALDDVGLTLHAGQFKVLLGPNGAGKTTLFSLITRLYEGREGRILVEGTELRRKPGRALKRMGVVFQQPTLDLDLTVRQNLLYHAALHGLGPAAAGPRIAAELGMPLSFAHFITQEGAGMVKWYRENFKSSRWFDKPIVNIGVSALAAETTESAREIGMSRHLMRLRRNQGAERKGVPSMDEANNADYSAEERAFIIEQQQKAIEGGPEHVKSRLEGLTAKYEVDEIIVLTITHDYADRIRSYELLAEAFGLTGEGR